MEVGEEYAVKEIIWRAMGFDTVYMVKLDKPDFPLEGESVGIFAAEKENLTGALEEFLAGLEEDYEGTVRVRYLYPIGKLEPRDEDH